MEKLSYRHLNPRKCYCGSDEKYRGFHTITNISNGICCELQLRKEEDILCIIFKVKTTKENLKILKLKSDLNIFSSIVNIKIENVRNFGKGKHRS